MSHLYSATWFEVFLDSVQPAQTEAEVEFIARHLPNPPFNSVLDVCCGPGRHSLRLAERGYCITGIDLNGPALDQARRQSNEQATFIELDMRQLATLPGAFDAALNLWQSFSYFDDATNASVLSQISQKLNPGGRFIVDIYQRGFFERHQGARQFERNGLTITETKTMAGHRLTVRLDYGPEYAPDIFDWQLYTPDELCDLARGPGLTPLVVCANFDESQPPSADSPRMQLVFAQTSQVFRDL